MAPNLEPTEIKNRIEDHSGVATKPGQNPYDALIEACDGDPAGIQAHYAAHRSKRNAQQREKFLSPDFDGLLIDPFLLRLEDPAIEPGFKDQRHCIVAWARPPTHVLELAGEIQKRLQLAAPNIWLMPLHRMHTTTLEIAFSRTAEDIDVIKTDLKPVVPFVASYTYRNRARLVKPIVSYDLSAFAVSFLPACGEPVISPPPVAPGTTDIHQGGDGYTYHHLRRDLWSLISDTGMAIDSRYVVPSAHITLGRYLKHDDHATPEDRKKWVDTVDAINEWLEGKVWEHLDEIVTGEWIVGQEKGLDFRLGPLWYGGGRTVLLGEGF